MCSGLLVTRARVVLGDDVTRVAHGALCEDRAARPRPPNTTRRCTYPCAPATPATAASTTAANSTNADACPDAARTPPPRDASGHRAPLQRHVTRHAVASPGSLCEAGRIVCAGARAGRRPRPLRAAPSGRGRLWPPPPSAAAASPPHRLAARREHPPPLATAPALVPQHQILQRIVVLPHDDARRLDLQLHVRRLAVHERRSAARRRLLHRRGSTPRLPHPVLPYVRKREHRHSVGHLGLHANHLAQLVRQRGDGAREKDSHGNPGCSPRHCTGNHGTNKTNRLKSVEGSNNAFASQRRGGRHVRRSPSRR